MASTKAKIVNRMHTPTLLQVAIALEDLYVLNGPAPVALSKSMTDISRHASRCIHDMLCRNHILDYIIAMTVHEATFSAEKRVARR